MMIGKYLVWCVLNTSYPVAISRVIEFEIRLKRQFCDRLERFGQTPIPQLWIGRGKRDAVGSVKQFIRAKVIIYL